MLADPAVEVVHLTSTNHLHFEQVRAALAAGKHVVCEKPLAMNSEETAELLRLAEDSGLVHAVNFNIRFYAQNQDARARVERGEVRPDVVFLHWPVDTHTDHQAASLLGLRACMALRTPSVFFFEVNAGSQTGAFRPDTYVDISAMVEKKKASLLAHASQDGAGIWRRHHEPMANWRGRECGGAGGGGVRAAAA